MIHGGEAPKAGYSILRCTSRISVKLPCQPLKQIVLRKHTEAGAGSAGATRTTTKLRAYSLYPDPTHPHHLHSHSPFHSPHPHSHEVASMLHLTPDVP